MGARLWTADACRALTAVAACALVLGGAAPAQADLPPTIGAHTCVAKTDQTVRCWGANESNQLGAPTLVDSHHAPVARWPLPVQPAGLTDAVAVANGGQFSCALRVSGRVSCWGNGMLGQLGSPYNALAGAPVTVYDDDAVAISAGYGHACAVRSGGTVVCWGWNDFGQLGNGTTTSSYTPVSVPGLDHVVSVSAGLVHTCAMRDDKSIRCWGDDQYGELGDGIQTPRRTTPAGAVLGIDNAVQVVAGYAQSCALLTDKSVRCWGVDLASALGGGPPNVHLMPTAVPGVSGATRIGGTFMSNCAVLATGRVRCWGWLGSFSGSGPADDPTAILSATNQVSGITDAVDTITTMAPDHICVVRAGGTVSCWGGGIYGSLGNGKTAIATEPTPVTGVTTATGLSVGSQHACVRVSTGAARCWGTGQYGRLGNGSTADRDSPVSVSSMTTATQVSAGDKHSCAVTASGSVRCWGYNGNGVLGNGNYTEADTPTQVSNISTATAVASASTHACARLQDATVQCWGYNDGGKLGDGTTSPTTMPVTVVGLNTVDGFGTVTATPAAIATGGDASCALMTDEAVKCWGANQGGNVTSPTTVTGLDYVTSISVGNLHACAVVASDGVVCWGDNTYHQIGDGTTIASATPVAVAGVGNATMVAAGRKHSCATISDGSVKCWGSNDAGQLGSADTTATTGTLTFASPAVAVGVGDYTSCALLTNQTVQCWGSGVSGQLGDGAMPAGHGRQLVPTDVIGLSGVVVPLAPVTPPAPVPAPVPDPVPDPPAPPAVLAPLPKPIPQVQLVGRKVIFTLFRVLPKGKKCSAKTQITVMVRVKGVKKPVIKKLKLKQIKKPKKICTLNGTVALPPKGAKVKSVKVTLAAKKKLRTRVINVRRTKS